jgi:tetratricopeptide (TPR) repeat protein
MSATVARRYFVRGREQLRRGDLDSACQEFGAAVELVPTFVEARVGYALTLARTDPPRAAQSLRAGLGRAERPSERRQLLCALGDVLLTSGDYLGAEEAYSDAIALGALHLHDRLGRLRAKTGRFAEALDEMLRAARARAG